MLRSEYNSNTFANWYKCGTSFGNDGQKKCYHLRPETVFPIESKLEDLSQLLNSSEENIIIFHSIFVEWARTLSIFMIPHTIRFVS